MSDVVSEQETTRKSACTTSFEVKGRCQSFAATQLRICSSTAATFMQRWRSIEGQRRLEPDYSGTQLVHQGDNVIMQHACARKGPWYLLSPCSGAVAALPQRSDRSS